MKNFITVPFMLLLAIVNLNAQMTVSGILDTTVSANVGAGGAPNYSFGFEEYANIRFQSRLREIGTVYGAVNLIAASGSYARNAELLDMQGSMSSLPSTSYTIGENFVAAIELERLYFRMRGEHLDFDGGLFRLPFGYSQVWGSSDFLNPRNPLKPDARLRGILGAALTWHVTDDWKLLSFYSSPRNPLALYSEGSLFGLSLENRQLGNASIQVLYSYETPKQYSRWGIHRAGLSLKLDIEIGLAVDALYTYNYEAGTELDGLSLSAGADYSFFDGNLIVMAEYLYNGGSSSTALYCGGNFSNTHYLYTGLTYRFNDFTNMSLAVLTCFDDVSFTPVITLNHDLFQGAVLTITAQVPLDRDLFTGDGNRGEFGPIPPGKYYGNYFYFSARIRLRF
ncbi:MAG: hypothetical protein FWB83_08925 [Treponema sp.]|nr:hypothetical protein [Treponema sp.]